MATTTTTTTPLIFNGTRGTGQSESAFSSAHFSHLNLCDWEKLLSTLLSNSHIKNIREEAFRLEQFQLWLTSSSKCSSLPLLVLSWIFVTRNRLLPIFQSFGCLHLCMCWIWNLPETTGGAIWHYYHCRHRRRPRRLSRGHGRASEFLIIHQI